jgi:hypothetical protein
VEVEGRKGDTTLTGADELYHDEAFRAKASPFQPTFNVNNFFEISICKPENFLTRWVLPYTRKGLHRAVPAITRMTRQERFNQVNACTVALAP